MSEDLSGPADEGTKKFALSLGAALARTHHDVAVFTTGGSGPAPLPGARLARAPRTFLSRHLYAALATHRPEVLVYAARPSTTFASFVRAAVLRAYCPSATVVLLGLQPRHHAGWQRRLIGALAPQLVCVQSPDSAQYLRDLGCTTELLSSGVDLHVFRPAPPARRRELRVRYGLDPDRPVALHVGHLKAGRGIGVLADLASTGVAQVLLLTSTSTANQADSDLEAPLRRAGVSLLTEFQPHVEQLYQLADCYVFPVESRADAIEIPLSVLEAFACDLPVVTTRFGGLPRLFEREKSVGLTFVDSNARLVEEASRICRSGLAGRAGTRSLALPYAWDAIAQRLIDSALPSPSAEARLHPVMVQA
ncbi:MAG TPA: glycosyltransferase family 4 protein [Chloroflexota bacterium]|nr:glycosyltransferase family 4 protein [Chloroflexota bacterium]